MHLGGRRVRLEYRNRLVSMSHHNQFSIRDGMFLIVIVALVCSSLTTGGFFAMFTALLAYGLALLRIFQFETRWAQQILVFAMVVSVVWLFVPSVDTMHTLLAFRPGTPDPNTYNRTIRLGWPLDWLAVVSGWNELHQTKSRWIYFDIYNSIPHFFAILWPMLLAIKKRWSKTVTVTNGT